MRGVKSNGLTDNRVIGGVCARHPELNGLRVRDDRLKKTGPCVGCERDRLRKLQAWKKQSRNDKPVYIVYGDEWKNLQDVMAGLGGYRRTTQ